MGTEPTLNPNTVNTITSIQIAVDGQSLVTLEDGTKFIYNGKLYAPTDGKACYIVETGVYENSFLIPWTIEHRVAKVYAVPEVIVE